MNTEYNNDIFQKLYRVKYNHIMSRSELDINTFGTHITGDKRFDKYIMNDEIEGMLSVYKISEYIKRMVPIRVLVEEDNFNIYKDCINYLEHYKNMYSMYFYKEPEQLENYLMIDNLANILFPIVRFRFSNKSEINDKFGLNRVYSSTNMSSSGTMRTVNTPHGESIIYENYSNDAYSTVIESEEKFDYSRFFKQIIL